MTKEEFVSIITSEIEDHSEYSKYHVYRDFRPYIQIQNETIEFKSLSGIFCSHQIELVNVEFVNGLHILESEFGSIKFKNVVFGNDTSLIIEKCYFKTHGSALFIEDTRINEVRLSGLFSFMYFNKANINKIFFDSGDYKHVILSSCVVSKGIVILKGNFNHISIDGSRKNNCAIESLYISGGVFKNININTFSEINEIDIKDGEFENINFKSNEVYELYIDGVKNIKRMEFNRINKINANIVNVSICELIFDNCLASKDSIFRVVSTAVNKLHFNNFVNFGQFYFNALIMESINALDDQNSSIIISKKSVIDISNSDLGKTSFVHCELSNSDFYFESSKISDVSMIATAVPVIKGEINSVRIAHGQMRKILENGGDNIYSTNYYTNELNAYMGSLKFRKDYAEKINLFLNWISTNHGSSWKRGLVSTVLVSVFFYILYVFSLGYYIDIYLKSYSISNFWAIVSYYFEFINPVHKTDSIPELLELHMNKHSLSLARVIEGVSRIFIGYFIYQLVQAFKRFGRK